ncbi:SCO2524 family protein [Streptomyces sp. NBC_01373]|uniref:SCO2524 family protein n=1 Tax=unclassified Streptomyces TaxID=2593676 RepID=UPI002258A611|nr:SCO2524 family protein [Streptomyces sp. NBC_01373]MCX4702812.1 SCO2524 family protein [Streptomyces sp. NBC_01373]
MIQPRHRLLDIWRSILSCSTEGRNWVNPGRAGRNSISDAEQLVCLLYPAFKISDLGFSEPDAMEPDVHEVLSPLGDWAGVPKSLAGIIRDYLDMYTAENGTPVFPPGGSLRPLDPKAQASPEQSRLETVEAFSMAVTFSLSALAFVKSFAKKVRGEELAASLRGIHEALDRRLTHAMRGLLHSFAVDVFPVDSTRGDTLVLALGQRRQSRRALVDRLRSEMRPIRNGLRDLVPPSVAPGLVDEALLFECGWSWGPVRSDDNPLHLAEPVPSLYFTATAMDGIVDLFSPQTLRLGLLGREQQTLAQELHLRWELTQGYWTSLARFGGARWPLLQNMPWRTVESEESDYATLQVASVVVHNLMRQHGDDEFAPVDDLTPLAAVLEELAARGGITRRPSDRSRTVELHDPGELIPLPGSERHGPAMGWLMADYAPMLLKRMLQVARLTSDLPRRDRLMSVADELVDHLWRRRLSRGRAAGLWDAPGGVFGAREPHATAPSWYLTERVVEVLVVAATMVKAPPVRSPQLLETAGEKLREAEHLFAQETMSRPVGGSSPDEPLVRIEAALRRARDIVDSRPGTSAALVDEVLRELDGLALARSRAARGG